MAKPGSAKQNGTSCPTLQDCLLYKLAIDVHEVYGKLFGRPLYRFYQREVLPLALGFYEKIDSRCLSNVLQYVRRAGAGPTGNSGKDCLALSGILVLLGKSEFVKHYRNETLNYNNLAEGCQRCMYQV